MQDTREQTVEKKKIAYFTTEETPHCCRSETMWYGYSSCTATLMGDRSNSADHRETETWPGLKESRTVRSSSENMTHCFLSAPSTPESALGEWTKVASGTQLCGGTAEQLQGCFTASVSEWNETSLSGLPQCVSAFFFIHSLLLSILAS